MKAELKTPGLEDIYTQRHLYEQHRKKLHQIRAQRKSHLGFDNNRMQHFENLKEAKNRTFMNRFNKVNDKISKQNLQLLGKLENVKPSMRHRSVSEERERNSISFLKPFQKQQIQDTEKQNLRISNRMKNMSSSLNQKQFLRDYAKSQQIKNRLMRYTADQSRVYLKSERYLSDDAQSVISHTSKKQGNEIRQRKSAASHYKKEEIIKNRIQGNIVRKDGKKYRPNTSLDAKMTEDEGGFFTTEPKRHIARKKRIYL